METDDDHATMRGSQTRFVNYVKFFLAFSTKNNIYDVFFQYWSGILTLDRGVQAHWGIDRYQSEKGEPVCFHWYVVSNVIMSWSPMPLHLMMGSVCHLIPLAIPVPENDTLDCAPGYPIPATGTANWDLITHLLFQIWHKFEHIAGTPGIPTYKSYCGLQFSSHVNHFFGRDNLITYIMKGHKGEDKSLKKYLGAGWMCVCVCEVHGGSVDNAV